MPQWYTRVQEQPPSSQPPHKRPAPPVRDDSSTAWFLFVAAHLFGAGVFLMVDAQEKIASQMSYEARTVD
eukprot:4779863-Prymnesium_polylepis.1